MAVFSGWLGGHREPDGLRPQEHGLHRPEMPASCCHQLCCSQTAAETQGGSGRAPAWETRQGRLGGHPAPGYLVGLHKPDKHRKEDRGGCRLGIFSKILHHIIKGVL